MPMTIKKLKEIGILEYHYHSIFFYTLARICKTKNTNVTLFTTKEIFSLIENHLKQKDQYTVILKKEGESINSFLKRVGKICDEKIDLLFVNSIQETCKDLPHYFRFNPSCKMILTIHNVNAFLNKKITINIKKPFRTLDTILSSIIIQRIVLPKFDGINVVYPPIKRYIEKYTTWSKPVYTLPFTLFDLDKRLHSKKKKDEKIRLTVPGAIEKQRRDYNVLVDVFKSLFQQYDKQLSLILLGRPVGAYGERILKQFKEIKENKFDITIFEEYIPEETYDQMLMESDVILAPLKVKTHGLGTIEEIYGMTKGASAPFEALQYAKPLIVPAEFDILDELKSSTMQYTTSAELQTIITKLLSDKKMLIDLQRKAQTNSNKLSLPVLQKYFEKNLLNRI